MKFGKKIAIWFLAALMTLSMTSGPVLASAHAVTLYTQPKTVALSGYKHYKGKKLTTYARGSFRWLTLVTARFSGKTGGTYYGTATPSEIQHIDYLSATGIGSASFSKSPGCTISGRSASYSYKVSRRKSLTCYPSYTIKKGLTFTATIYAATRYRWGTVNYRVETGDAK